MKTTIEKAKGKRLKAEMGAGQESALGRQVFLGGAAAPPYLEEFYPSAFPARGYLLIEVLVYIAVVTVVLAITTEAFYRCWGESKALSRNADDIIRAMHAGEQWRADVRAATGAVELTRTEGGERLLVPSAAGPIIYAFAAGELRRQTPSPAPIYVVLANIESSQMQSEQRQRVQAWTWELELKPARKDAKVRPRFTFETVAGAANTR